MLLVRAKGKYDRTWGKEQADRGRDTGVVVNLGGRDRIWARVEVSGVRTGELSRLSKMVSGWVSMSIWSWGAGGCGHALLAACKQGFGWLGLLVLAWPGRRSGIGGLLRPSLPKKGSHCKERI